MSAADGYTLTVKDAAALLGLSIATIYGYVREGKLPCLRTVGRMCTRVRNGRRESYHKTGRVRFSRAELETWIAAHHTTPTSPAADATLGGESDVDAQLPETSGEYRW